MIASKKTIILMFLLSGVVSHAMVWNKFKRAWTSKEVQQADDARFINDQIWPIKLKENSTAVKRFLWRHRQNPHYRIDNPTLFQVAQDMLAPDNNGLMGFEELLHEHDVSLLMQALKIAARFKTEKWNNPNQPYSGKVKMERYILETYWKSLYYVLVQRRPYKAYKSYQHRLCDLPIKEKKDLEARQLAAYQHALNCAQQRELRENTRNHEEYDSRMARGQELRERAYESACRANVIHEQRENELQDAERPLQALIAPLVEPVVMPADAKPEPKDVAEKPAPDPEKAALDNGDNAERNSEQFIPGQLQAGQLQERAAINHEEQEDARIKKDWVMVADPTQ
jgi:hypothetical protein